MEDIRSIAREISKHVYRTRRSVKYASVRGCMPAREMPTRDFLANEREALRESEARLIDSSH